MQPASPIPISQNQPPPRLTVGMLSSVGDRCGIAAYTRSLVHALKPLADVTVEPITEGKQDLAHYQAQADRLNAFDVIHVQHEHSFWGGILPNHSAWWILRYLLKKPVVLTAHTTTSLRELLRVPTERRPLHRIAKELLLLRRGYRDSVEAAPFITGRCIVHTRAGGEELVARGANPKYIHVIPAGVPEPLPAPTNGMAFREKFGLVGKRLVSLFGYIAPNKGYELALQIVPELPRDTVLVIAGGARTSDMAAYTAELSSQIRKAHLENRVVITNYLPEMEVAEAMAASEVVIAPHTYATGSYSIMIPLAYGKPVVASDMACFVEIKDQAPCLALFHAGDPQDFLTTLNSVLNGSTLQQQMSRMASEYAQSHSWREVARETVTVYQEAIADVARLAHHA